MSAAQHTPGARSMRDHSFMVEWQYVVPPANTRRLVIAQRQDGPFRGNAVGGRGHYYTSQEALVEGRWTHIPGSATGGHATFEIAFEVAERAWLATIAKATGSAA